MTMTKKNKSTSAKNECVTLSIEQFNCLKKLTLKKFLLNSLMAC